MQNGSVIFEDSLIVSYKAKHSLRYDPAIALLSIYPIELKTDVHTHKNYKWMFLAIHSCQKLEKTKVSSHKWMDKQTVAHPHTAILFSNKRKLDIKPWRALERNLKSFSSVQFSHSVVSDSLLSHEPQHVRPPCPSPTPRVYSNSCPLSQWCHPAISSSVVPFSSCPQSLPASGSFPMSQLFAWGSQSIGVSASASVLPMNTQDWSPLWGTGWISLQSKGLSRVFSNTTVQKSIAK